SYGWMMRFVWLVAGFNVGFILPTVLAFLVLPALLPDFAPRRVDNAINATLQPAEEVAFVVVTSFPSETPLPTSTPTQVPTVIPPTEIPPAQSPVEIAAQPSIAPSSTPFPTATFVPPTVTPLPAPASFELSGFNFQQQTWNNCGPANLAMGLSYYGWEGSQVDTARFLKPDREDKNVSPDQMIAYVNEQTNLKAIYRVAGTRDILRWLVSNEFAVIIESGYEPPGDDWYGHYRTVVGYDDSRNEFYFYDSYLGREVRPRVGQNARDFDADWQAFNRTFIVIYPQARELELQNFLGREWNVNANWRTAADVARSEAAEQPDNAYAWFNLGTALTNLGDYQTAGRAFDQAFNIGLPWRMMWYQFGPYEAYFQSSRLDDVVALAQSTVRTTPYVEETYYYLGRVYEVLGDSAGALVEYKKALQYNQNFREAAEAVNRLDNT
ncbi:MAG TPA: C39 family peptidase, partial [Aggregatilineales bacterium]|nr:C39 family peptidase [Aggregatilineales bacterium]